MFTNEINPVYDKVNEVFKLSIKSQVKGSGIVFEKFYKTDDLITGADGFGVVISNRVIHCSNTTEFYQKFLKVVQVEAQLVDAEIASCEATESQLPADKDFLLDQLYYKQQKLHTLTLRIGVLTG